MNLKVLFVAFLCIFSVSISTVATIALNATGEWSFSGFLLEVPKGYLSTGVIDPNGDPIDGGGGWPR